jgi:hypothetical protein
VMGRPCKNGHMVKAGPTMPEVCSSPLDGKLLSATTFSDERAVPKAKREEELDRGKSERFDSLKQVYEHER